MPSRNPHELDIEELLATAAMVTDTDPDVIWEVVVRAPDRRLVVARVPAPALGWATVNEIDAAGVLAQPIPNPVHASDRGLVNGLVDIVIGGDGSFRLTGAGSTLDGVGRMVDGGEFGDSYNYGPPVHDTLVDRPSTVGVSGRTGPDPRRRRDRPGRTAGRRAWRPTARLGPPKRSRPR